MYILKMITFRFLTDAYSSPLYWITKPQPFHRRGHIFQEELPRPVLSNIVWKE